VKYEVKFPNHSIENNFEKALSKIHPIKLQEEIIKEVEKLIDNPRPYGEKSFKKLKLPVTFYQYVAQYRIRISDYRVLYDVDDGKKTVWVLALRRRSEKTYKE
jgi:mRNA-degrading endonuclease RelE of RelBE toxin-antitoxin system